MPHILRFFPSPSSSCSPGAVNVVYSAFSARSQAAQYTVTCVRLREHQGLLVFEFFVVDENP